MTDVPLNPMDVALELLTRNKQNYRAAEVEAWKLRDAHGRESAQGRVLADAAFIIADMYHDAGKKRDVNDLAQYRVPVFPYGPNSSRTQ